MRLEIGYAIFPFLVQYSTILSNTDYPCNRHRVMAVLLTPFASLFILSLSAHLVTTSSSLSLARFFSLSLSFFHRPSQSTS